MYRYFWFKKNDDGTYTYFGKKVEKKPKGSFGLVSPIRNLMNFSVFIWAFLSAPALIYDEKVTALLMGIVVSIGSYLIISDMKLYKKL